MKPTAFIFGPLAAICLTAIDIFVETEIVSLEVYYGGEAFVQRFFDIIMPLFVMTLICMSCLNKNKEYIMIGKRGAKPHNDAEENQICL